MCVNSTDDIVGPKTISMSLLFCDLGNIKTLHLFIEQILTPIAFWTFNKEMSQNRLGPWPFGAQDIMRRIQFNQRIMICIQF